MHFCILKIFYLASTNINLARLPMDYFLFFAYLIMFPVLVGYLDKKHIIRIDTRLAAAGFVLKVGMACLYGYIFQKYYGGDDTWMYHRQSLAETEFLKTDPLHFLHSLIDPTAYTRYMMTTWWQEVEYASLIKLLALMNVFSGGCYYVNAVLFSMITFWGSYFYYRFFITLYPHRKAFMALVFFFFVPMVFWTSGIRKDGLIFLFSGMLFYAVNLFFEKGGKPMLAWAMVAILGLALNRNFVALAMIPPLAAWWISRWKSVKPARSFVIVYAASLVIFFVSSYTGPFNIPAKFVQRQADFMALKGGSYLELGKLDTDPLSFIQLLPQALNHVFLRPYPGESNSPLYVFSALETWFVLSVMLLALIFPKPAALKTPGAPVMALLYFALSNYLFIGYTIPFLGAIVRYRIVYETILLALALASIHWEKLIPRRYSSFFKASQQK